MRDSITNKYCTNSLTTSCYRLKYLFFLLLFNVAYSISSCSKKHIPESSGKQSRAGVNKPINQADPSIFHYKGTYYLYGTNDNNSDSGFVVYSSKDMKNWIFSGQVLSRGDAYGDWGFWAPQVWEYKGKFYIAYTANERISIAESNSPMGPFKQEVKEPLKSSYRQIDPFLFIDDDGKKYLYHVRLDKGNHIYVAELTDDFSAIKPDTYKQCITATSMTWEHVNNESVKIAEGPTVIKKDGFYYLFYSVNDFRNKDYAVGYAVSKSVNGPWTRYTGNPILHSKITGHPGSGHGDIVKGKGKNIYYVLHTHNASDKVGPRKSAIIKFRSVKGNDGIYEFVVDKESFKYLNFKSK